MLTGPEFADVLVVWFGFFLIAIVRNGSVALTLTGKLPFKNNPVAEVPAPYLWDQNDPKFVH